MKTQVAFCVLVGGLWLYCQAAWSATADSVVIYPAFTSTHTVTIEGRVVERKKSPAPNTADSSGDNFRRAMELMINNERKNYPVTVRIGKREWRTATDQEGYFRVAANDIDLATGWHDVAATTEHGEGGTKVQVVPTSNTQGLISDIDDTVQITEVNSKTHMLANTFLRNALQRQAVPGIVPFYRDLAAANPQPDLAPIIYLSASPRQLHAAIDAFLLHNQFPRGVLITKRVTDDSTSEPITNQVAYKTAKIESILAQLPAVRFTLVGDDGEHDPEVYSDIQKRFPDRVTAVWIRQVNPDPNRPRIAGQGVLDDELRKYVTPAK